MAAKSTVDWSGGPTAGVLNTVVDAPPALAVDPYADLINRELLRRAWDQKPTLQRQAAAMRGFDDDYGRGQYNVPMAQEQPQEEQMISIYKPGPYPGSIKVAHRVPIGLAGEYAKQGWLLG